MTRALNSFGRWAAQGPGCGSGQPSIRSISSRSIRRSLSKLMSQARSRTSPANRLNSGIPKSGIRAPSKFPGLKPVDSAQKLRVVTSVSAVLIGPPCFPAASRRHRRYSSSGVPLHPITTALSAAASPIHRLIEIPPRPRGALFSSPRLGIVHRGRRKLQAEFWPCRERAA